MGNSATPKTYLPITIWGATKVYPVEVVIDTVDTDLTVFTPANSNLMGALVGGHYKETTEHTLKLTDGTDLQVGLESGAAGGGLSKGIGKELIFCSQPGSAIKLQSSAAISQPFILYFIEATRFDANK